MSVFGSLSVYLGGDSQCPVTLAEDSQHWCGSPEGVAVKVGAAATLRRTRLWWTHPEPPAPVCSSPRRGSVPGEKEKEPQDAPAGPRAAARRPTSVASRYNLVSAGQPAQCLIHSLRVDSFSSPPSSPANMKCHVIAALCLAAGERRRWIVYSSG